MNTQSTKDTVVAVANTSQRISLVFSEQDELGSKNVLISSSTYNISLSLQKTPFCTLTHALVKVVKLNYLARAARSASDILRL